jgi:hypothetical protein
MSEEGRVTPADGMRDISLSKVTPETGEGALGIWRALPNQPVRGGVRIQGRDLQVNLR